jgi:hypothetical protein
MGLDNGIIAKIGIENEKLRKKLFKHFTLNFNKDYEIAYWRKCWNVRKLIILALKDNKHIVPDIDSRIELTIEDIDKIIKILKSFTKYNWEDHGYSPWSYKELKPFNKIYIKNLKKIKRLMKKFPNELEVYFYDSY